MPRLQVHWRESYYDSPVQFGSTDPAGADVFAVIGPCAGELAGQWGVRIIRADGTDLFGRAASVAQAKRYATRWASAHAELICRPTRK